MIRCVKDLMNQLALTFRDGVLFYKLKKTETTLLSEEGLFTLVKESDNEDFKRKIGRLKDSIRVVIRRRRRQSLNAGVVMIVGVMFILYAFFSLSRLYLVVGIMGSLFSMSLLLGLMMRLREKKILTNQLRQQLAHQKSIAQAGLTRLRKHPLEHRVRAYSTLGITPNCIAQLDHLLQNAQVPVTPHSIQLLSALATFELKQCCQDIQDPVTLKTFICSQWPSYFEEKRGYLENEVNTLDDKEILTIKTEAETQLSDMSAYGVPDIIRQLQQHDSGLVCDMFYDLYTDQETTSHCQAVLKQLYDDVQSVMCFDSVSLEGLIQKTCVCETENV